MCLALVLGCSPSITRMNTPLEKSVEMMGWHSCFPIACPHMHIQLHSRTHTLKTTKQTKVIDCLRPWMERMLLSLEIERFYWSKQWITFNHLGERNIETGEWKGLTGRSPWLGFKLKCKRASCTSDHSVTGKGHIYFEWPQDVSLTYICFGILLRWWE